MIPSSPTSSTPRRPEAEQRRSVFARSVIVLVTTLAVVGLGFALESGLSQFEGIENPQPDPIPDDPRLPPPGPPPSFGPEATELERLQYWQDTLAQGDQEDVVWSVRQFERAGDGVRSGLIKTAQRSLRSNSALLQRVLEFLVTHPGEDAIPLAMDCIGHADPDVAARAAAVLAAVGGDAARPAARQLANAAVDRDGKVPQQCLDALVRIGGDECEQLLREIVGKLGPAYRAYGYLALSRHQAKEMLPFLRERFAAEENLETRLMAAEALVRMQDDTPLAWLEERFAQSARGGPIHDRVLTLLAFAAQPSARAYLEGELRSSLLDERRGEQLVPLLRFYPPHEVAELLETVGSRGKPKMVRIAAWEIRAADRDPAVRATLLRMLASAGQENAEERDVAAFTLGRVRDPATLDGLLTELAAVRGRNDRLEQLVARAVVLVGDPRGAEAVVRAMVEDRTDYGIGGTAFGIWRVLGDTQPAFAEAFGRAVARALDGEWGQPDKAGLQHLILAAGQFCGTEQTANLATLLRHPDANVRQTAALVIAEIGGRGTRVALETAWRAHQEVVTRDILRVALEHHHYRAGPRR